jgi:chlorite dismutase
MSEASRPQSGQPPPAYHVDVTEHGAGGQTQDRRLFLQLQVFTGCTDPKPLVGALERSGLEAVLYRDLNDPRGIGVLALAEDPALLVTRVRETLAAEPFDALAHRPELSMVGRTYASGFEADLAEWLLARPRRTVLNPAWPWAIWYPLRRTGSFARLAREDQGKILHEHATIGRAYGEADLAHDVRLACYGLDTNDNDFVIGLVGPALQPLSHLVQAMRRTIQTSEYIEKLGPFFVGHALWQAGRR